MSSGKVEIGCFRSFSEPHIQIVEQQMKVDGNKGGAGTSVPMDKIKELGAHYHKYYQLETSFFKSSLDDEMLNRLWNEYWIATLSGSPLLSNQREITNQVNDINKKV